MLNLFVSFINFYYFLFLSIFPYSLFFSPIEQAQHRGTRLRHRNSLSFSMSSGSSSSRKATSSLSELRNLESDLKVRNPLHFLFEGYYHKCNE